MRRTIGGGQVGEFAHITVVPDSTFITELSALVAAGTQVDDSKLVNFTFSNNWEVTSPADNALPDGKIIEHHRDQDYTWILTIELYGFTDINGTWRPARGYVTLPYPTGSSPSLQEQVQVNSTTYYQCDGGSTGIGAVVSLDEPTGYFQLLI